MHDFFDKLGAAAKRAAGNVANEVSVAAEKQKLSDCYKDLGKRYYQAVKNGETPDLTAEIFAARYPGFSVLCDTGLNYCYYHKGETP